MIVRIRVKLLAVAFLVRFAPQIFHMAVHSLSLELGECEQQIGASHVAIPVRMETLLRDLYAHLASIIDCSVDDEVDSIAACMGRIVGALEDELECYFNHFGTR